MSARPDYRERVRADWLLAHEASWHLCDRRMANQLKARAARRSRNEAGAAESSHHEGRIKPIAARFVARGEDSTDRVLRVLALAVVIVPAVVFWLGPALALSAGLHAASTRALLARDRVPRAWPWLVAAAAGAVAGWLLGGLGVLFVVTPWPMDLDFEAAAYLWFQAVLGLALTAWQVRRHGWPGVTVRGTPRSPSVPSVPEAGPVADRDAEETTGPAAAPPRPPAVPTLPDPPDIEEPEQEEYEDWMADHVITTRRSA